VETNDNDLVWPVVAATEIYLYWTIWDALVLGSFKHSGLLPASPVTINDEFRIFAGFLTITANIAT
jgi:hypothetical protein